MEKLHYLTPVKPIVLRVKTDTMYLNRIEEEAKDLAKLLGTNVIVNRVGGYYVTDGISWIKMTKDELHLENQ